MPDRLSAEERAHRRLARKEEALRNDYLAAVRREVVRRLSASRSAFDADDIASIVIERLCVRLVEFMTRYPDPVVFARAVVRNTTVDFDRSQNSQRGAGARVGREADGSVVARRTVISGDLMMGESGLTVFDTLVAAADPFDAAVVEALDAAVEAVELLRGIPARQAEAIYLSKGLGFDHSEIGVQQGRRRETVCRAINQGMATLATMVAERAGDDA